VVVALRWLTERAGRDGYGMCRGFARLKFKFGYYFGIFDGKSGSMMDAGKF